MRSQTLLTLATCTVLFAACNNPNTANTGASGSNTKMDTLGPVTLTDVTPSPDFPGASLSVASATSAMSGKDSVKVSFKFDVKNYDLKMQTTDNGAKMCNNSDKGQHIHFILDNTPYKALYEPSNDVTLPNDGKEHYLMAFLSRSYHESIKTKGAAVMYHFMVDQKGNMKKLDDPKTPMIVYSRPKGDYSGHDTVNILLDFYVWNCDLSASGYKVKAEIANQDRATQQLTATLDKWQPRFIKNLGTGKSKVTLTLMDKDGKQVEGPQTTATREFNLKSQ